jgi:transposase
VKIKGDRIQLAVDYDRLKEEEKYDGLWAVVTNWFEPSSREIVRHYKGLRQVEDGFKALKSDLELGPMYHWVSPRIKAHVFICFLALLLQTALKKKLQAAFPDQSPTDLIRELSSIDVSCVHLKDKSVWLRSEISEQNLLTLNALHCQIPKKIL